MSLSTDCELRKQRTGSDPNGTRMVLSTSTSTISLITSTIESKTWWCSPRSVKKRDDFPSLCLKKSRGLGRAQGALLAQSEKTEIANLQFLRFSYCQELRLRPSLTPHFSSSDQELKAIRNCAQRGAPLGDEGWVESIARRLDLESTMRPRGRPRVRPLPKNGNKEV